MLNNSVFGINAFLLDRTCLIFLQSVVHKSFHNEPSIDLKQFIINYLMENQEIIEDEQTERKSNI